MIQNRRWSSFDRPVTLEVAAAVLLCVLLGARVEAAPYAPVAGLIGLALLPVVLPAVLRFHLVPALLALLIAAAVAGVVLTAFALDDHESSLSVLFSRTIIVMAFAGGIAVVLFARTRMGSAATAIAYAIGLVLGIFLDPVSTANPWRFSYSLPIGILVLALLAARPRFIPQLAALIGLAVIGFINDSRSNSAMLLLVVAILVWQRLSQAVTRGRRRAGHVVGLALVAVGVVQLLQFSVLEGYFGEASREKSAAQVATSGDLLLGGRPEAAASFALIRDYPLGMGSGIQPSGADVYSAKSSMSSIGYDPNNGYVERFMFGNGVEVHSVLGDFWLWFGLFGLAACVVMAAIVIWGMEIRLRTAGVTALVGYLAVRFFWDLLFSPVATSTRLLMLTIPLLAVAVAANTALRRPASEVTALGGESAFATRRRSARR